MRKYTQRELKNLVSIGAAHDITNASPDTFPAQYNKIGYSRGIYGINGGLIQDRNGELYAITARNTNLFRFF